MSKSVNLFEFIGVAITS